jgi:hypothetical protein
MVRSPETASSLATFRIVVVLPSWGAVPVTSTTCEVSLRRPKSSEVRRFW